MDGVTYTIEQHGDSFELYSLAETAFGGVTKKFVRRAQSVGSLAETIRRLENENKETTPDSFMRSSPAS